VKRYKDIAGDGGSNIAGQVEAQQGRLRQRLASVRAIVAVVSGKGGVGKSALTANLACCFALDGWKVGVLDADLNGPTQAKLLGVRGRRLVMADGGVEPPRTELGVKVMSMDLLLAGDAAALTWDATVKDEAHTWRGAMEANAVREFLADTNWGALDALLLDLPPGTDRLATIASLAPTLAGIVVVTLRPIQRIRRRDWIASGRASVAHRERRMSPAGRARLRRIDATASSVILAAFGGVFAAGYQAQQDTVRYALWAGVAFVCLVVVFIAAFVRARIRKRILT